MSYTVLARRYRSRDFDEIVGQEAIARTLQNAIEQNRTAHAYLFCGTRGVGKTSMARIFAKALNVTDDLSEKDKIAEAILKGEDLDVIEIDGASNRGVNEARDLIASAGLRPARGEYKIYIIDEVHMLTKEAFNALLKTMEEPPEHVKFILATTDPHKVPATIQSRCQRFDFRSLNSQEIAGQLRQILEQEGIDADEEVVAQVARFGDGSMRDALSLLDRLLATGEKKLTVEVMERTLGLPDQALITQLVDAIIEGDAAQTLERGQRLLQSGSSIDQALELLTDHLRNLMLLAACGTESPLLDVSPDARQTLAEQAEHFDPAGLVHLIAICDNTMRHVKGSTAARAIFDAALVRMAMSEHLADIASLIQGNGAPAPGMGPGNSPGTSPGTGGGARAAGGTRKKKADAGLEAPSDRTSPAQRPGDLPSSAAAASRASSHTTEVKPAAAPSPAPQADHPAASSSPVNLAELDEAGWRERIAAFSPTQGQQARLDALQFLGTEGRMVRFALAPDYLHLRRQQDSIADLVRQVLGDAVQVTIETPEETREAANSDGAVQSSSEGGSQMDAVRSDPLVRQAIDLFDASITGIEPAERARGS